jgi:spore coat protein U-like protein
MKRTCIQSLAATALLLLAANAQATISCNVSSPGFTTSYDPAAVSQTIVQTNLTATCVRGQGTDPTTLTYSVGVDNGAYFSAGSNRAKLTTGASYVQYDLYSNSLCTNLWRTTPSAKRLPVPGTGTMTLSGFIPTSVVTTYWGCIPAGQTGQPAGIYLDTVPMTLYDGNSNTAIAPISSIPVAIFMSATCNISTAPGVITFNYTSFGPAINPTTTFGATCTSLLPYTMALDVTSGALLGLNYSLALSTASSTGTGVQQTHTITGTMVAGQAGTCAVGTCSASQMHALTITY